MTARPEHLRTLTLLSVTLYQSCDFGKQQVIISESKLQSPEEVVSASCTLQCHHHDLNGHYFKTAPPSFLKFIALYAALILNETKIFLRSISNITRPKQSNYSHTITRLQQEPQRHGGLQPHSIHRHAQQVASGATARRTAHAYLQLCMGIRPRKRRGEKGKEEEEEEAACS